MSSSKPAVPPAQGSALVAALIRGQSVIVPILAVAVALLVGAVLIWAQGVSPAGAYTSLMHYAWFTSDGMQLTLLRTASLALTGLAVAIPLRIGMFNIGAQGQLMVGALVGAFVGYRFSDWPGPLLILACFVGAILGGAAWGWLAGILKAKRNVHEVISTIMLNYVAAQLIDWLLNGALKAPNQAIPQTPPIAPQAHLGSLGPIPVAFVLALALAIAVWWLMRKTVLGFKFATVGTNPEAARYAGIKLPAMYALGMTIAGGLAGLSGAVQTLGETHYFEQGFAGTLGFDGVTIALLARGNPLGCIPAAFLLASLRAGAPGLQFDLGVQQEIVDLLLAITLLLVSIPILPKLLFRGLDKPVVVDAPKVEEAA